MNNFTFKILWLENNIALAIDHVVTGGYSPLTPYFFWPRNDAWTQIKTELDSKPWISQNDKVEILNNATLLINYWQENNKSKSINNAQNKFPEFIFCGDYQ